MGMGLIMNLRRKIKQFPKTEGITSNSVLRKRNKYLSTYVITIILLTVIIPFNPFLTFSVRGVTYEDFTTYTEIDPNSHITVTTTKVEWSGLDRNEEAYVYKDFGVGFFGDFEHDVEIEESTGSTNGAISGFWIISNVIDDMQTHWTGTQGLVFLGNYDAGNHRFIIRDGNSGNQDIWVGLADTLYYCIVTRVGNTFTVKLYDDVPRTNLKATLSVACSVTTFRYLYSCSSFDSGVGLSTGYSQNFNLNLPPVYPPTQSNEIPINGSANIGITPNLYVLCTDIDNDNLNATWWSNSSGTWVQFASNWTGFPNNTIITQTNENFSIYGTTYFWSVNLTDGIFWYNKTYHFTTEEGWDFTQPLAWLIRNETGVTILKLSMSGNMAIAGTLYEQDIKEVKKHIQHIESFLEDNYGYTPLTWE